MADYNYIEDTGVIVPDTSTLQSDVQNEFRTALGADIIVTENTPQGVLIAAEVSARAGVLGNNALLANQINPNIAGGVFLDAIWQLTGGQRYAATRSVIAGVVLGGLPNTTIPAGSLARLADGTEFESTGAVILDSLGAGMTTFQAVDAGPVAVNPGQLNEIVTGILGWDSITNPNAATVGRSEETDLASRQRRRNTLSLQNVALPEAITSALYDTPNVRSLAFRENVTSSAQVIDGVSLKPHSVFACVDGGTDADVAAVLLANKSLGADWNGDTAVNVLNGSTGQSYPVQFQRPEAVNIMVRATVKNQGTPADVGPPVRQAVLDFAAGDIDGEAGFVVGANVSPFELAGAIAREVPAVYVQKVEVSLETPVSWSTNEILVSLYQVARVSAENIIVVQL